MALALFMWRYKTSKKLLLHLRLSKNPKMAIFLKIGCNKIKCLQSTKLVF